jgi:hypothetical protein
MFEEATTGRKSMRKAIKCGILLSLFCILTAMGTIGGEPTGRIPAPLKNFRATAIDHSGVSTKLSEVSFDDGKIFFVGLRGKAMVTIGFEHIEKIALKDTQEDVSADILLKDGSQMKLNIERAKKFFGRMEVGTYEISMGDLKELRFE